jgi:3D (Asp-Asp-Asp) domain-containing protein
LSKPSVILRSLVLATTLMVATVAAGHSAQASDLVAPLELRENDTDDLADASTPSGRSFVARLSAYAHGTRTASGTPVRWGVVSVDPRVIPLGSKLMIDGFDTVFVAEDTGGAVRGNHIDIYFPDRAEALRFGVQHRTVTILS